MFARCLLLTLLATALQADQLALWDFDDNAPLSGIVSGTNILADKEYVFGSPYLEQLNQDIDSNGKAGNNYTDSLGIYQDSPDANDAIAWNDIRGSGTDGELVIVIDTRDYQDLSLSFEYKYENDVDGGSDLMELLYSTNNGSTYTKFGSSFGLIDDAGWHARTFNLASISGIENNANVRFKIQLDNSASSAQEVNNELRFDNIEVTGENFRGTTGAPELTIDASSTPYLSLFEDPVGFVNGTIDDPTDPASVNGITFNVDDPTPSGVVTLSASSSNTSVVPNSNLVLTFLTNTTRNLKITPTGIGTTTITVIATDSSSGLQDFYLVEYAASAASSTPEWSRFHTIKSDASTGIDIGANYMWVADDEDQVLRLYDRQNSGWRVKGINFNSALGLSAGDEADLEASAQSGATVYWMGSHGNDKNGGSAPDRNVIFKTTLTGSGASSGLNYNSRYNGFKADLLSWDSGNGHGLGNNYLNLTNAAASGQIPESINGFNIEGLAMMPSSTTGAYVGFRAPLIYDAGVNKALLVPVNNFSSVASGSSPNFGQPILLDLGGRGIRSITRNANDDYLIVAGPPASIGTFAIYIWDGNSGSSPTLLSTNIQSRASDSGASPEGIIGVNDDLSPCTKVQLLMDSGSADFYNFGIENKDIAVPRWKKFRTDVIDIPAQSDTFTVTNTNDDGAGSLRHLIECANDTPGKQTIEFALAGGSTIILDSGITISDDLDLVGPGNLDITLNGNGNNRHLIVTGGVVDIFNLRFFDGFVVGDGGSIKMSGSATELSLRACDFVDNEVGLRGGALSLEDGLCSIRNCTFRDNDALASGGAINANNASTLYVAQSTFSANRSLQYGGAILAYKSDVRLVSCTVTSNFCDLGGGGLAGDGGGIAMDPANSTVALGNTIVADNFDQSAGSEAPDLSGDFITLGYNLIGSVDGSNGIVNKQNNDLAGDNSNLLDPLLSPLQNNGGPLLTHEPEFGSAAVEGGSNSLFSDVVWQGVVPSLDQRDETREQNDAPDIGAVEFIPYIITVTILDSSAAESPDNNHTATVRFTRDRTGPAISLGYSVLTGTGRAHPGEIIFSDSTIAFPDSVTTVDLVSTPVDDTVVEGTENLLIYFPSRDFHITSGPILIYLDILDNDLLVDTYGGSGAGSLPAAVNTLNSLGGGIIAFDNVLGDPVAMPRTVSLPAPLAITSEIEICGPTDHAAGVTLSGNDTHGIFLASGNAELTLKNLTLTQGLSQNGPALELRDSSSAEVYRCTFTDNTSDKHGGAIYTGTSGTLLLQNSTLSNNIAAYHGGAIYSDNGTIDLIHTTIVNNACDSDGDGNGTGGGLHMATGTAQLLNTIVANNTCKNGGAIDLTGNLVTGKGNLIGNNLGATTAFPAGLPNAVSDYVGSSSSPLNPRLFPLRHNGGPTMTHAPGCDSPAIDNGNFSPPSLDQRSLPRSNPKDIGAVEHQFISYPTWADFTFPKVTSPATLYAVDLDYDNDGWPNGLERLHATDPTDSNDCPSYTLSVVGGQMSLQFYRAFDIDPSEMIIQRSAELEHWKTNQMTIQTQCLSPLNPRVIATFNAATRQYGRVIHAP